MSEEAKPNGTQFEGKEEYVKDVFTEIASYYDEMNDMMSMGMIRGWHRFMMKKAGELRSKKCLDVGTGTGEIAFLLSENVGEDGEVYGVDITPKMLECAEAKMKERNLPRHIIFEVGDALSLRFEDESFDVVTSGYMLRNVTDIQKAIGEMHRVLRPGGRAVVAELSKPKNKVVRYFYELYMKHRVSRLGRKYDGGKSIDGRYTAYEWLTSSVEGFPRGKEMTDKFLKAGFSEAHCYVKSMGAVNIYVGIKK
ncbi:MAG: bifunctional demethylmenaquinone methyltransferase/2-methoxy-6-polyprenyl-1,4-benzoquinol methylase UbiE [Methanomassiliicoccaceae archaeon]|nr:bifunctional demethylmenaquinone methyltransferase/2-methoxy-6-polyprenyl-1,4-benzoquinol methylase UbiE [Methanomassiliicoccaceae archaeon]